MRTASSSSGLSSATRGFGWPSSMRTFFSACKRLASRWRALRREKRAGATAARIGATGVIATPLDPTGFIAIAGELWPAAISGGRLAPGARALVVGVAGARLLVAPLPLAPPEPPRAPC
ncbi:MAG: hypothetical protein CFK52_02355 [Chloracidobacterium sp. CP2_5A]|nr:MAG: hypothetical protein CFK52_02355 [Chloracidobacterium sp. CP2_5A]